MAGPLNFLSVFEKSGILIDRTLLDQLVSKLAGAQQFREENHPNRNPAVTRSMLLVVLNELDSRVSQLLNDAGPDFDWSSFLRNTGLEGPITEQNVEDVTITYEFSESLMQLGESVPSETQLSAYTLALYLLKLAIDDRTGSIHERLEKSGANLEQMREAVDQALDAKQSERSQAWLLQYKNEAAWTPKVEENGDLVSWYSNKRISGIKAGDPVIYWRMVGKTKSDRGGLVGTGRFLPESEEESLGSEEESYQKSKVVKGGHYIPTQVVEWFPDELIPRDELINQTGLEMNWRAGSIQPIPEQMADQINQYLINTSHEPIRTVQKEPIVFVSDAPTSDHDYLNRSDIAFLLAARLNLILTSGNQHPDAATEKSQHETAQKQPGLLLAMRKFLSNRFFCWFGRKAHSNLGMASFVAHVDAPWGGGKTSFANFLEGILNPVVLGREKPQWFIQLQKKTASWPMDQGRHWHSVMFNAWLHQHLDPPWWCFYQSIRQQCFSAVLKGFDMAEKSAADAKKSTGVRVLIRKLLSTILNILSPIGRAVHWIWLWVSELAWRLFTPKVTGLFTTLLLTVVAALLLSHFQYIDLNGLANVVWGNNTSDAEAGLENVIQTILIVLFGGATAIWTVVAAFTETLLPGTPDAAKNYSLGSGDPLDRFRRRFDHIVCGLRRPVLVVIDDLDRCEPEFVVEMMRGIQTIFRSPRVVFIVLGDRNWIEHSFSIVHKGMKGIPVGPEHTFGGRFVEKVFQLSLVLPGINPATRETYVTKLLVPETIHQATPEKEISTVDENKPIEKKSTQPKDKLTQAQAEERKEEKRKEKATKRAFKSAMDPKTELQTRHRLLPVSPVLPDNPRQIKRIINAISFYQEIATITHDWGYKSTDWCQLALWVIIMTEWPTSWARLAVDPDLVDRVRAARQSDQGNKTQERSPPTNTQKNNMGNSPPGNAADLIDTENESVEFLGLKHNEALWRILDFQTEEGNWRNAQINKEAIEKLNVIMPASNGASSVAVDTDSTV